MLVILYDTEDEFALLHFRDVMTLIMSFEAWDRCDRGHDPQGAPGGR